jgi:hypothetical protein
MSTAEPGSLKEALESQNGEAWKQSLERELQSMLQHGVWRKASKQELAAAANIVDSKVIVKHKYDAEGRLAVLKSRLVARGFSQVHGVDYHEIFAPTAKITTVRLLLALAAQYDLEVEQMDVVTAFLCGQLQEHILMQLPKDLPKELCSKLGIKAGETVVLQKTLYGLKQSPREWHSVFASKLQELGFMKSAYDPTLFFREGLALVIYVDDILVFSQTKEAVQQLKEELFEAFDMKDLGAARHFLGMEVTRDRRSSKKTLKISQKAYIDRMLARFGQSNSRGVAIPMETGGVPAPEDQAEVLAGEQTREYQALVGSLLYAALMTRPDIAFAVSTLGQHCAEPTGTHLKMGLRVLRYLKETKEQGLCYGSSKELKIDTFSDADWAGCRETRRSTTGFVIRTAGAAVSYASKKQRCIASSSTEAEYVAAGATAREVTWFQGLLDDIATGLGVDAACRPMQLHLDNQAAIAVSRNPQHHTRMKHIDVQHHYIREKVLDGQIDPAYTPSAENAADILTKPLPKERHGGMKALLGVL